MALHLPTRELVGLLADVYPFASPDDDDSAWHRVIIRWDGHRLHALAGDVVRLAWMSWGPDDGDDPVLPGMEFGDLADDPWELAILPDDAKQIATKFKLSPKEGAAPLVVDGNEDRLRVVRDSDVGRVALTGTAVGRPWDDDAPDIADQMRRVAKAAADHTAQRVVAYPGAWLADFCNPKVVRPNGPVFLHFGPKSTYIQIGRHFQGAILQSEVAVK